MRIMEIPQRTHIFKINCCLKVHNAHLKLASSISGYVKKTDNNNGSNTLQQR